MQKGSAVARQGRLYSPEYMKRVDESYNLLNPKASGGSGGWFGGSEFTQRKNDATWRAGRNEYLASLPEEDSSGWDSYNAQTQQNQLMAMMGQRPAEQPQAIPEIAKAPLTNYGAVGMGMGASMPKTGEDKFYTNALRDLWSNPAAFQKTPGFKAALDTGRQAIERSMAARGLGNSGNVLAELMKYGTGLASQEYGSQVDRLSRLSQYEQGNGDYWKNTRWGPRA